MSTSDCKLRRLLMVSSGLAILLSACQTPPLEVHEKEAPPALSELGPEPSRIEVYIPEPGPAPSEPEPLQEPPPKPTGIVWQAEQIGATVEKAGEIDWLVVKGDRRLQLTERSRKANLNGTVIYLNDAFFEKDGTYALSESDFEYILKPALNPVEIVLKSKIVAIDPGHGGAEPGSENQSLGLLEKDLNLDVSMRLKDLLEEKGYKVVLTRYNDRLVPLEDRSKIANRANAGIFVSIHFNASINDEASGIETYVLTPPGSSSSNGESLDSDVSSLPGNYFDRVHFELGYQIQSRLVADLQRVDRGLKKARFMVLKDLECPGLLVEGGFLSHSREALLVNTPVYRQKLAESLSESLVAILLKSNS